MRALGLSVLLAVVLAVPAHAAGGTLVWGSLNSACYFLPGDRPDCRTTLHRQLAAGGPAVQTGVLFGSAQEGAWTPDGRRLVYVGRPTPTGPNTEYRLFTADATGDGRRQLTSGPAQVGDRHPTWSPDASLIAFSRSDITLWGGVRPDGAIWVMAPDGSGARMLTTLEGKESRPVFSPDGRRLTFQRTTRDPWTTPDEALRARSHNDLWSVGVDGTDVRRLTLGGLPDSFQATPSPDGERIAIESADGLHVLALDGSQSRGYGRIGHVGVWSPDSRALALRVVGPSSTESSVRRLDLGTGEAVEVVEVTPDMSSLDWIHGVPAERRDEVAPAVVVGVVDGAGRLASETLRVAGGEGPAAASVTVRDRRRLRLLVLDETGLRRVEAAVIRRGGRRTSYRGIRRPADLRRLTARLRRGTSVLRIRTRDVRGNRDVARVRVRVGATRTR